MADQVAEVELRAKPRGLVAGLREARHMLSQFADGAASKMGGAFGRLFDSKKGFGGSKFGKAGGEAARRITERATDYSIDFLKEAGKSVFNFEDRIKRLKIASGETPEVMADLARGIRQTSDATGLSKDKILSGAEAYLRLTGDMKTAREQTSVFAKVAQATNSEVGDIAETAAAMGQNLKIPASEFEAMFSAMAIQGKAGAIELRDLSKELSTIAPQWAQFGRGTGTQGLRELGAAMQIVKRGFGGDAGETTVGLSNFLTAVTKKGARFREAGVGKFFTVDSKGRQSMKDVFTIIDQISKSKLANNKEGLLKAFGSIEAYRAYIQLRDNRAELDAFVKKSEDRNAIDRDYAEYMEGSTARLTKAWEVFKNKVADTFTPERVEAFASKLESIAEKAGFIADAFGKVGDFFGGIQKAGQDIRGMITGEGHITMMDRMRAKVGDPEAIAKIENIKASADYAAIMGASSSRARKFLGIKGIEGEGRDASAQLAFMYSQAQGPGAVAKRAAAERFYKEQGLTSPEKLLQQAVDKLDGLLKEAQKDRELKVGSEPVVKATKNAPSHRAKVAK